MLRTTPLVALGALVLVAGCYRAHGLGEHDASTPVGSFDAGLPPPPPPRDASPPRDDAGAPTSLAFRRCDGAFGARAMGVNVHCATIEAPLFWEHPDGRTIELAIERILPPVARVRAQLWMLQGGPGGSSLELETMAPLFQQWFPDVEILLVDHRGVGLSTRLGCALEESMASPGGTAITDDEWDTCLESVRAAFSPEELAGFSTTAAARDLGELIERARRDDVPVFVYGVSYGTYWAHRWLQRFPHQADGVVLDSICAPDECVFPIGFSRGHETVGAELMRACAADATCRARMAGDPLDTMRDVLRGLDEGSSCASARAVGLDGDAVRLIAGVLLRDGSFRGAIPAMIHRLARCAPEDAIAFRTLADLLLSEHAGDQRTLRSFAPVLAALVIRSEMWERPEPSESDYFAALRSHAFNAPMAPGSFAAWNDAPRYARDALVGEYADTSTPLLMLNGTLDPQTTMEDALPMGMRFTAPAQTFVTIDRAPHAILFSSTYEPGSLERTCGSDLMASFLDDPRAPLDTSCRTRTAHHRFDDDALAGMLFGTTTLWHASTALPVLGPEALAARERLRRLIQRPLAPPPMVR